MFSVIYRINLEGLATEMTGRKSRCIKVQITVSTSTFYSFSGFGYLGILDLKHLKCNKL